MLSDRPARAGLLARWRPYLEQVAAVRALLVTLWSLPRRGRREVWIGDSHAAAFVVGPGWALFLAGPRRELVLRVGARLMYSLANRGFPRKVTVFARFVGRFGRRDAFAPIFVAGEIDVRNSLPEQGIADLGFVRTYLATVVGIARTMRSGSAYVLVPPPPAPRERIDAQFPSVGTDAERLAAFRALRDELVVAAADEPAVVLLDLTDALAGPDGFLRADVSDDGCHVSPGAHALVRDRLHALPQFVTGQS